MSLLMDALRKAEAAKRRTGDNGEAAAPAPELSLEPETPAPSTPSRPDLAQHLESLDADPAGLPPAPPHAPISPPSPPPPLIETPGAAARREEAERTAARNVFAAKQAPHAKAPLRLTIALAGAAILGIGGYFWWQLQTLGSGIASPGTPPRTPTAPLASAAAASPAPPVPATTPAPPAHAPSSLETPLPSASHRPAPPDGVAPSPPRRAASPRPPEAGSAPESPIRLSRGRPALDPQLGSAYEALRDERLDDARRNYEAVLRSDPKNADALLGLACVASRRGEVEQAESYYLRTLESDPRNVEAQAALLNLKAPSDPALSESRLKNLLAGQPDSPALNFALGNLFARQNRWSEAQQAYFRASGAQPENADYLFNLAVSLEHLRQPRLAAQYYQMALNAAGTHGIAFDRAQVQRRIQELQP